MTARTACLLAALLAGLAWLAWPDLSALWTRSAVAVFRAQQDLNRQLAEGLRALDAGGLGALAGLVGLGFLYGILHALGPGHGKAVMSAYVLGDARRLRQGLALAWCASALQALGAIVLVGLVMLIFGIAAKEAQFATLSLERAGYGLVLVLGLAMMAAGLHRSWSARAHAHGHGHDHRHAHPFAPAPAARLGWRDGLAVLAVGIRPCSGAVLVLAFAKGVGAFAAGILATLAMAVGTAITVSSLALAAFYSRRVALRLVGRGERWAARAEMALSLLAGGALALLGALLLAGSLSGPVSPFRI